MKSLLLSVCLWAICLARIEAGYGGGGGFGGYRGGYNGGPNNGYNGGFDGDYGDVKDEVNDGVKGNLPVGGEGYGGVKDVEIKPAAYKPPVVPYVKPYIKSYQKFPQPYGQEFGFGGYKGKVVSINKLFEYQPKFDIEPYLKPYEGAHLLQKHGKPMVIVKYAPPVYIKQPPIEKTIIKKVYVEQPVIIKEQPVIEKTKQVTIKKKPAIVNIAEKAPVDVKDFGQTAVVKDKEIYQPGLPKEPEGGAYEPQLSLKYNQRYNQQ